MAWTPVRRFAPRSPEPSRDRDTGTLATAEERIAGQEAIAPPQSLGGQRPAPPDAETLGCSE